MGWAPTSLRGNAFSPSSPRTTLLSSMTSSALITTGDLRRGR
ncbi:hypothetical protein LINPERPRIM_LOCUS15400 [Linum perenne]